MVNGDQKIYIELNPVSYTLTVRSNVKAAYVTVKSVSTKDSWTGNTDFNVQLAPGYYEVTVGADGYTSETRQVKIDGHQIVSFDLKQSVGKIVIFINGQDLNKKDLQGRQYIEVYDNGQKMPQNQFEFELRPGQHTIQIVSGALMSQVTINMEPGKTYIIEPYMGINVK